MTERTLFDWLVWLFLALAVVTLPVLLFVTAPYGRHGGRAFGPKMNSTLGWLVMESPSALVFLACWWFGTRRTDPAALCFLALWELHYVHRAFVFPFRRRGGASEMPVAVAALAFMFTFTNGYLNGRYVFAFAPDATRGVAWLRDPRFLVGTAMFLAGFAINQHADHVLFNLRKPGETGYKIPHGGLYRWITCPNYFGEIVEWFGWALLTWSLPGLVFALWTVANLVPRALSHQRWYQQKFPEYPRERRAIIPFLL